MPSAGQKRHKNQETIRRKPQTLITYFVPLETVFETDLCLPSQRPRPPQLLEDHQKKDYSHPMGFLVARTVPQMDCLFLENKISIFNTYSTLLVVNCSSRIIPNSPRNLT